MHVMSTKLTYSDQEIVQKLLSDDSVFEAYFFQEICKPLLSKISYVVFDNQVPVEELTNEFLCLLKDNNWAKLKEFKFNSTLFGWLKIVAVHYFNNNKERLYPNYLYSNYCRNYQTRLVLDDATEEEILSLLKLMTIQQYHDILYLYLVEKRSDTQIADLLCLADTIYKRKKNFALEHLKSVIINAGSYYENMYLQQDTSMHKVTRAEWEGTQKENELLITKMDVATLVNLMPNDRYRQVIRSLVLEERERKEVAIEMGITTENLDNIKCRALKQLAEIARKEML